MGGEQSRVIIACVSQRLRFGCDYFPLLKITISVSQRSPHRSLRCCQQLTTELMEVKSQKRSSVSSCCGDRSRPIFEDYCILWKLYYWVWTSLRKRGPLYPQTIYAGDCKLPAEREDREPALARITLAPGHSDWLKVGSCCSVWIWGPAETIFPPLQKHLLLPLG